MKRAIIIIVLFSSLFLLRLLSPSQIKAQFCGDPCTGPYDCDAGLGLECTGGICNGDICPLCTGDSGYIGVCEYPSVCENMGKTVDGDGTPSCTTYGKMCCTDLPSGDTCQLSSPGPFCRQCDFPIHLTSTTPNTIYTITSSPPTCLAGGTVITDASGNADTTSNCWETGNYTMTAKAGSVKCSFSFTITMTGEGDPCIQVCCPPAYCLQAVPGNYKCDDPSQQCCFDCTYGGGQNPLCGDRAINTAIGCIPVGTTLFFTEFLLRWALGLAGGIAFILILYAGFQISTSAGDPQRLQAGKELLTAALTGLLLIIFSVFLLRVVGVDILGIF